VKEIVSLADELGEEHDDEGSGVSKTVEKFNGYVYFPKVGEEGDYAKC